MPADSRHIAWIKQQFRERPDLEQQDLAAHLGRAKPMVTHLLQGKRLIRADEWKKIEEFFGKKLDPDEADAPHTIAVEYRIGLAWYEDDKQAPLASRSVASVLSPSTPGIQLAFEAEVDIADLNLRSGGIVIAVAINKGTPMHPRMKIVYKRQRPGLVQYAVGEFGRVAGEKLGIPYAIIIETRQTVR